MNMVIKNTTNKTVLAKKTKFCKTALQKAKGLMFTKKKKDTGLVFEFKGKRRVALHMMFVFYPIDVLFLNAEQRVVEIKKNFRPFSYYKTKNKILYAIELPKGSIGQTKKLDKIEFY